MKTFQEYFKEQQIDDGIGILSFLFAYHGLDAENFVEWYVTEGQHMPTDELIYVLTEAGTDPQQAAAAPKQYQQQSYWKNGLAGAGMGGIAGAVTGMNPMAALGGAALGGAAGLAKTWWNNRKYKQQQAAAGANGQQPPAPNGQQQPAGGANQPTSPQQQQQVAAVGKAAEDILPHLNQLKTTLAADPDGTKIVDSLIQHLGQTKQGQVGSGPAGQPAAAGGAGAGRLGGADPAAASGS